METKTPVIAQGYLYLEPFEARMEVMYDLGTVLQWINQPTEPGMVVPPDSQASIRTQVGKLAADWCKLFADDGEAQGRLATVAMVKGKPGATLPMLDGERATVRELLVGIVYEFSIPPGPAKLEMRWKSFLPPVETIPVTIFYGSASEQQTMRAMLPQVRWINDGRLSKPKPLSELPAIEVPQVYSFPIVSTLWILFGVIVYLWVEYRDKKFPGGMAPFVAAWAIGIVMTWNMDVQVTDPFAKTAPKIDTVASAETILSPLLKNVYRAFDYRKEQDIYDRLEHSVHGDLLRTLYLQTVKALTLEGQEGTRTRVSDLSVTVESVKQTDKGFTAACEWTAMGTVGHWGHQHTRVNRYRANVTVVPVVTEWKISGLEVLEERRL